MCLCLSACAHYAFMSSAVSTSQRLGAPENCGTSAWRGTTVLDREIMTLRTGEWYRCRRCMTMPSTPLCTSSDRIASRVGEAPPHLQSTHNSSRKQRGNGRDERSYPDDDDHLTVSLLFLLFFLLCSVVRWGVVRARLLSPTCLLLLLQLRCGHCDVTVLQVDALNNSLYTSFLFSSRSRSFRSWTLAM